MLTSDDLPTFERPTKATSGRWAGGSVSIETPPVTKRTSLRREESNGKGRVWASQGPCRATTGGS